MKIRHKQSGVELEGEFMGVKDFFMEVAPSGMPFNSAYSKAHWEEVKPEQPTWRDVTAECEVIGKDLVHRLHPTAVVCVCGDSTYRLTRISGPLAPHVAFIVEQQE